MKLNERLDDTLVTESVGYIRAKRKINPQEREVGKTRTP